MLFVLTIHVINYFVNLPKEDRIHYISIHEIVVFKIYYDLVAVNNEQNKGSSGVRIYVVAVIVG